MRLFRLFALAEKQVWTAVYIAQSTPIPRFVISLFSLLLFFVWACVCVFFYVLGFIIKYEKCVNVDITSSCIRFLTRGMSLSWLDHPPVSQAPGPAPWWFEIMRCRRRYNMPIVTHWGRDNQGLREFLPLTPKRFYNSAHINLMLRLTPSIYIVAQRRARLSHSVVACRWQSPVLPCNSVCVCVCVCVCA